MTSQLARLEVWDPAGVFAARQLGRGLAAVLDLDRQDQVRVATALSVWVGSLVFAAFGLFMGYLLPTENVMQFLGFGLMLFAFGGGLFIPLSQFPQVLRTIAEFTPLYGLNALVHAPLLNGSTSASWVGNPAIWIANALVWLIIFSAGAAWRFRKDTARV